MEEINKSYYAIIPANIRYDESIVPNAKLLYGEITALSNEKGYCWASNNYFADLYKVSKVSISKWVNQLVEKGYLSSTIIYKEGSKEILYRYLRIVNDPIKENFNTPIQEKLKDNNTLSNNTFNKDIDSPSDDEPEDPKIDKNQAVVDLYKNTCTNLAKVAKLTSKRRTAINKLLKEMSLEEIEKAFKIINYSEFCKGVNERGWKADFDFCIRPDKLTNALEGKYSGTVKNSSQNKTQQSRYL
jgi:hypothetical protein